MRKFLVYLFLIFPVSLEAKELEMELKPEGMYVANVSVAVVQEMFKDYGYNDFIYIKDWQYPPIFLNEMPEDFGDIQDQNLRNKLFLQILVPLTLRLKEELLLARGELVEINRYYQEHQKFAPEHIELLEDLAIRYDVFSKFKDERRYDILIGELLLKVDVVPPSMLLAAAAAESNWGTARELGLGNSLYKMKEWYTDEGIKPLDDEDDSYRIKVYPSLYESIKDYAHKLNTDINFDNFRAHRSELRRRHEDIRGRTIIYNMVMGSPLLNYAGLLSYILTFYDLINIDESELADIEIFEVHDAKN